MKFLPNLDVIRFILALLVLIKHVPLVSSGLGIAYYSEMAIFNKGKEAVYMFFALSGFLIIRLIYIEKQKGTFSIKKFYIRRILRIFPLYYLVLIFGFVFYHLLLPFSGLPRETDYSLIEAVLLTVFFLPNVFVGAFDVGAIHQVLWSIGIEEQFYLFIAPMSMLINKNWLLKALIILTVLYLIVYHSGFLPLLESYRFFYFFLFFGGIVSILEEKKKLEFLKQHWLIPLVIVIVVGLFYTTNLIDFGIPLINNLVACIFLSLFIHTIGCNNFGVTIRNKALNYFGKISYGIYMYHIIILYGVLFLFLKVEFFQNLDDATTIILINVLTIFGTLLVSHFSFQYFEMKFLKLKQKFRE